MSDVKEIKEKCILLLKKYTGKKHIFFTDRGNSSILLALKLAKEKGKKNAILQNQGGWITYGQYLRKLKIEMNSIETDYGIVDAKSLEKNIGSETLILINSMPGYHALQKDMDKIEKLCKSKGTFLINDASGSIGREEAKFGDIILGSFGEWKPIEVKYGGFIAFDEPSFEDFFKENFKKEVNEFFDLLYPRLVELPENLKKIDEKVAQIKKQLKDFDVLHRESYGLDVIVKFRSEDEKQKIIDFCKVYDYEYTICPRYIRVLDDAISIEVKRG
jgi:hypothetical protein